MNVIAQNEDKRQDYACKSPTVIVAVAEWLFVVAAPIWKNQTKTVIQIKITQMKSFYLGNGTNCFYAINFVPMITTQAKMQNVTFLVGCQLRSTKF